MWAGNAMLEGRKRKPNRAVKHTRTSLPTINTSENGSFRSPNEDTIMTRKPIRIRRQRIPILQSGYCAICNQPYNSVEDHVQSKKHQKLIGEDANYIALNGYIHSDVGIESLLSLSGIDALGFDDFAPKTKRRNMPRTRASSVVSDVVKATPPPESDKGHRLRSRKNINYMTPPLDEDSFQDKPPPDLEPVRLEYKEYRELRSSTRALAKLTSCTAMQDNSESDVWESGRPKRACISRHKRSSTDERLVSDNQTFYKVEVLSTSKPKSSDRDKGTSKRKESKSSGDSDKALIVKFKKLRNTGKELVQLNNEATNFLFPKKDDSSDEDEAGEGDEDGTTTNTEEEDEEEGEQEKDSSSENNDVTSSSELEDFKPPGKFKVEDDASMDSTTSSDCTKTRRKRRSHAEAFIMDNQKYYKFETPGSSSYRLRYHGSYLSPVPPAGATSKANGDLTAKTEAKIEPKVEKEERKDRPERLKVNLDEFTFSFETVPENEKWYQTFRRQDRSEQSYHFTHNYHWNDFVLPHQIPHLKAIDPRTCYNAYKDLKECICKAVTEAESEDFSSESDGAEACDKGSEEESSEPIEEEEKKEPIEQIDEDSKLSEMSSGSVATTEEIKEIISAGARRRGRKRRRLPEVSSHSPSSSRGKNPRKSPRQHASTLAILSSLVNQRKRRSRNADTSEVADTNLQTIPEEQEKKTSPVVVVEEKPLVPRRVEPRKPVTPQRQRRKKVDYFAIAAKIEEELNTALDFDVDFEPTTEPDENFMENRLNVDDIMRMYEESKAKENEYSCRRFFNGAPGRKPGKRKINMTGWPNKVKRKRTVKEGENGTETIEGNPEESDEEDENEDSDSINEVGRDEEAHAEVDMDDRENKCDQDIENRVGNSSEIRDNVLQPYVYVKKIDNCEDFGVKKIIIKPPSKRTLRRPQMRISPGTTKSPRVLRRPKGRWYRDR